MTQPNHNNLKPRILIAGHLPPPMGGIATYYQALLNSSLKEWVDYSFVETSSQNRSASQTGRFSISNVISAANDCLRFARAALKNRPQVTHIATAFGLSFVKHSACVIIARLLGIRVLLHPHCGFSALYGERPSWWKWYFRKIIRMTDGVITLSSEWKKLAEIVPGHRIFYLPNGIDLSPFHAAGLKNSEKSSIEGNLKALYLGHLGRSKGTYIILEAARQLLAKRVPIIIDLVGEVMGDGDEEEIKSCIDQKGLTGMVFRHPPVTGTEKIEVLGSTDIFVYPSFSEGMPIAVIEAMACGLPIIATKVGGIPDLVSDGINGVLIEAGSIDQLTEAIENVCRNPELRLQMQKNSFQMAFEKFDIEKIVPQLVNIYTSTLSAHRRAGEYQVNQ
jgi:glycosyltransferase involved in cell wall biosynthesis